jgi:hypothetical protein
MTYWSGFDGIMIAGIIILLWLAAFVAFTALWRKRLAARHAAERRHCDRCRAGNAKLPCGCSGDCRAPACLGWLDEDRRAMLRGDR